VQVLAVQRDHPTGLIAGGVLAQPRSHRRIQLIGVKGDQHPPQRGRARRGEPLPGLTPSGTQQPQQLLRQVSRDRPQFPIVGRPGQRRHHRDRKHRHQPMPDPPWVTRIGDARQHLQQ
jgi:hypothetical protein